MEKPFISRIWVKMKAFLFLVSTKTEENWG